MHANEQYYPKTEVGICEFKQLPPARLIVSETSGSYFQANNGLFRPLFRYIQENDIAMTTPVEAEIEPGKMYFYVGQEHANRSLAPTESVRVVELSERTMASIGVRGAYSASNFQQAAEQLKNWLADRPNYVAEGAPRGVFWNGPFTPGFIKRFEVHIPVRLSAPSL